MIINHKNLIGLPVETKNGLLLGKIKSFEIDSDTQTVLRYVVKSRSLISKLLSEEVREIIVGRNQVISLDEEKMIVHDTLVKELGGSGVLRGAEKSAPVLGSRLSISKIDGECTK
jgi:sporulation protein YlmC with PRC-barrel domain